MLDPFTSTSQFTSAEVAFLTNLAGLPYEDGDILYYDSGDLQRLPIGSEADVLTVVSGLPSWEVGGGFSGWTRTLIVDQGGLGDYTTIKGAVDYATTQTPTATTPWQILVMSGKYDENPFSIPVYVTVSGFVPTTWGNFDTVLIDFTTTLTSGIGITMANNSDLGNLVVKFDGFTGTQTGDITLISGANKVTGAFIQAYTFSAFGITGASANSSSAYITGCTFEVDNFGAGAATSVASAGNNTNLNDNLIRTYVTDHWGVEVTAGDTKLFGNVFDGPSSIKRTGGTVTVNGTSYNTTSGTITFVGNLSVEDEAYGAGWNGSQEVPTKNALYDKIETLGGASAFTDLTDVPSAYTGDAGKYVKVNATEDGLEFVTGGGSGGTLDDAYDFGGAGAGADIIADSGAVTITVPDASNNRVLELYQEDVTNNPFALYIENDGTANEIIAVRRTDASGGPSLALRHESTTPAALDTESILFQFRDSGGNLHNFVQFNATPSDVTDTAESGIGYFNTILAGSSATRLLIGGGFINSTLTGFNGIAVGSVVASNGAVDLILRTGNSTTSNLTITDGANGDITANLDGTGSFTVTTTDTGTAGPILHLYHNTSTPAVSDRVGQVLFSGEDSAGNTQPYGFINLIATNVTSTTEAGQMAFGLTSAGTSATHLVLNPASLTPATDGSLDLGTTSLGFQNLHLNTGATVNIENGNWVATHTSGILTVGTGDLRVTNNFTNATSVVTLGGAQTLTNKTLTTPVISSISNTGTITLPTATTTLVGRDTTDTLTNKRPQPRTASSTTASNLSPDLATANVYYRTTQTATLTIDAPTGTPVIGEVIAIYVDSAGAQTLNMNATYIPFGAAFPATTTAGKTLMITAQYNGTNWKTLWAVAV